MRIGPIVFLGASVSVHLLGAGLAWLVFLPPNWQLGVHRVELVAAQSGDAPTGLIVQAVPVIRPPPAPRQGAAQGAVVARPVAEAIDPRRNPGSAVGVARPSAAPNTVAGADTRLLKSETYTHPELTLGRHQPSDTRRVAAEFLPDAELEPTPFIDGVARSRQSARSRTAAAASRPGESHFRPVGGAQGAMQGSSRAARDAAGDERVVGRVQSLGGRPQEGAGAARKPQTRRPRRDQFSARREADLIDAAPPQGTGEGSGQGNGSLRGRRGDPRGEADGAPLWLSTADRRYVDYFRRIYRKVHPLWWFPKELEIQLEQGEVLVQFTILANGEVANVEVRKSSGFPRFDRNVLVAIRRAAPFDPIPRGLGTRLRVLAPFEFQNPMVR